jgi:Cd2+/Zn2+-exporting ATPase
MAFDKARAAAPGALKLRIDGMDCGACALKIESALKRLPGVSNVNVNYATESVTLTYDEDRTSLTAIDGKIRTLGFTPKSIAGVGAAGHVVEGREEAVGRGSWWRTRRGRHVVAAGALLGLAFLVAEIAPAVSFWAYFAAAVIGLAPVARRAVAGAASGTPFGVETLMSIAVLGAIAIGAAQEAAVVIFLFAVGELLETIAGGRARAGIKALMNLVPRMAQRDELGQTREVPVEQLRVGDTVVVRPGDRVPSDGDVIDGDSDVDEAPVTGESVPVPKSVGSSLYAGSISLNGVLRVRITRTAADNTIARIIHLVEQAQASKAPTARFIDRFATWYTPSAMAVAGLIMLVPPVLFAENWLTWVYRGLASLLIACPCALVISTPAAIASGLAAGTRRGLLIKGGAALESLSKVTTIAFDKTGTLTSGTPHVTDVVAVEGGEDEVLGRAAAVERGSSHPVGRAIIAAATARRVAIPEAFGGATAMPGKAVTARLRDGFVSVGSRRHAEERNLLTAALNGTIEQLEDDGKTVVIVSVKDRAIGLIALRDELRPDAAAGVERLKTLGVRPLMLTGDNRRSCSAIASALGVEARAELLPDAKLHAINELKATGPVAMIGDGINDAPALAAASVGVAMGGGTDVALETADAALLKNRVLGVAELVELSRATLGNIRQNIGLALGLKGVFLATTLFGVTSLWMAILADTGATVLVTANALRLLRFQGSSRGIERQRS